MDNELQTYLDNIAKNECYITEKILKETSSESTEIVTYKNPDSTDANPTEERFIRKQIIASNSLGLAYERIWKAQQDGMKIAGLPHIYDYFEIAEKRIVIMEYIPGRTLEELIASQVLSQEQIFNLFFEICRVVTTLHEEFSPAIIHRDLKPSNIMVSNGRAVLIDFGIARSFQQEAETDTQHFGTRAFAPPEQFGFSQTDQRSDEYALAALLFYCLSMRIPSSKDREQYFTDARIPALISDVLNKALSLDPSARYASVAEFVNALQQRRINPAPDWKVSEIRTFPTKPKKDPNRFFKLKVIWDILVAFTVLILLFGCTMASFFPVSTDAIAQLDLPLRTFLYVLLFVGWVLPIGYLVSAREPLFRLFNVKKRPTLIVEIGIAALFMLISGLFCGYIANTYI